MVYLNNIQQNKVRLSLPWIWYTHYSLFFPDFKCLFKADVWYNEIIHSYFPLETKGLESHLSDIISFINWMSQTYWEEMWTVIKKNICWVLDTLTLTKKMKKDLSINFIQRCFAVVHFLDQKRFLPFFSCKIVVWLFDKYHAVEKC